MATGARARAARVLARAPIRLYGAGDGWLLADDELFAAVPLVELDLDGR